MISIIIIIIITIDNDYNDDYNDDDYNDDYVMVMMMTAGGVNSHGANAGRRFDRT